MVAATCSDKVSSFDIILMMIVVKNSKSNFR